MPLRALRAHVAWAEAILAALPGILAVARAGAPVLLRFPRPAPCFEPLAAWLQSASPMHVECAPRCCFTVEFVAMGTSV